ncbi:DnaJ family domain-containing protein [Sutcliffiella horikoshii]|uniref:DnaJ family domain-containing protein n=1 Tax=Sutcliffiella horikoshii TaxID=79883 RepID=UPI003CFB8A1F
MDREYNDLIGDILKESGEKDIKGKGKPLSKEYLQMDTYQNFQKIAREAGYLPEWLKLQKEISLLLESCQTTKDLKIINKKIKEHNNICPFPMQKGFVSFATLNKAREIW